MHMGIGKVERRFRFYQECADAMLRQCGAPPKFKFMAIKFINYVQNYVAQRHLCMTCWELILLLFSTLFGVVSQQLRRGTSKATLERGRATDLLATVDNIARRFSNGIGHFRTDEGSDWKSSEVADVVRDRGIHISTH